MKPLFSCCISALLVLCVLAAQPAQAQPAPVVEIEETLAPPVRPSGMLYLRPRLGLAAYGGDRSSLGTSLGAPGPVTGIEIGKRQPFLFFNGGYGLSLMLGRYPSIADAQGGTLPVAQGELNMWRHTLALSGYTELMPRSMASPYLRLGAGATGGLVDTRVRVAFTPLVGVGLDIALNDAVGVFAEATGLFSFSDNVLDGASNVSALGYDVLTSFGGGVRVGFNKPFAPLDVIAINGPTVLDVGDEAEYAVATLGGASEPVSYTWQFGDGTRATGARVAHRFEAPGNYTISVTGENEGSRDVQLLTVAVEAPPAEAPVVAQTAPDPVVPVVAASDSEVACAAVVELNSVRFAKDRTYFSSSSWDALDENLEVMRQCPDLTVRIVVYQAPDETQALADRRAQAVEAFYTSRGIGPSRIVAVQAVTPDVRATQKEGLAQLRRVETQPAAALAAQPAPAEPRTTSAAIER